MKSLVEFINESQDLSKEDKRKCLFLAANVLQKYCDDNNIDEEDDWDSVKEYAETILNELTSYKSNSKLFKDIDTKSKKLENYLQFVSLCNEMKSDIEISPFVITDLMMNIVYVCSSINGACYRTEDNL